MNMEDIFSLHGKLALITGGATGIGYAIADQFIRAGARVVISGRTAEKLTEAIRSLGENCSYMVNDVTDREGTKRMVREIEDKTGPLEILVNNAGAHIKKPVLEVSDEEFESVIDTNLRSVFSLTREVLKYMIPRGSGSVINISSMAAIYGLPGVVAYSSSKTGLLGLTRTLATENSHTGVRFNAIAPGFIKTDMFEAAMDKDPDRRARIIARTPAGRFGTPDDIGIAAVFLASQAADYITGVCLPVDGGNSIGF
jgi:NAD(P)-dependent dehydrogenase (short-subunit alcohol dehydrogenase family)